MDYKEILSSKYNRKSWKELLYDIFLSKVTFSDDPYNVNANEQLAKNALYLGEIKLSPTEEIAIYEVELNDNVNITRNRRSIRDMLTPEWKNNGFVGAYILSYRQNESILRFSYVSETWGFNEQGEYEKSSTATKRYTYLLGEGRSCRTAAQQFAKLSNSKQTLADVTEAFSVEALSKEFYTRLYGWYEWALSEEAGITFPNNPQTSEDIREDLNIKLIRLLTRLLFVWFIKQKNLVPDDLFSPSFLKGILKDFDKDSMKDGCFYNAILQNLFFATLNCAIYDENKMVRSFSSGKPRDIKNRYRYAEMFTIPKNEILDLFARIPFLNGGLFECLDYPHELYKKLDHDILYDGFSRNATLLDGFYKYRAFIPNKLFFNEDENQPGLITLLKEYNFTIEENRRDDAEVSLDPELLGQVFENLLAAYNPETQVSARNATGSFYTPRVIVDYMVDEALIAYIKTKQIEGVTEESLRELFQAHKKCTNWTKDSTDAITMALKEVKILDPACGSGAFPMGCLLRIVDIIETLSDDENFDRYDTKLRIIENCIYGVDIQSIAMMICKLRFFISLICDQQNIDIDKPKENFGVNTLPNLETKFVAANTLLSAKIRKFENTSDLLLPNDETLKNMKDELLNIRNKHLVAKSRSIKKKYQDDDEKMREKIHDYIVESASKPNDEKIANLEKELEKCEKELESIKNGDQLIQTQVVEQESLFGEKIKVIIGTKDKRIKEKTRQIQSIKDDISRERNKSIIQGFEAAVKQLTDWDPYDQNSVSPFFDAEWMFGMADGFDIVIGNPPYIQLANNHGMLGNLYADCEYDVFERAGDIYCLFYERGQQLLKDKGHLCFITSNKWMRAGYGEKLRGFLANRTNPELLIDFGGVDIFESATVDTNILLFSKSDNIHKTLCADFNRKKSRSIGNLSVFVEQQGTECSFENSDCWVILSDIEKQIKRKIEAVGTPLKDWDIQINYGIKTGCNAAFIISTEKRNEILNSCKTKEEREKTDKLIRPILRGRDIKRYSYNWAGLWLIYIPWHFPYQFDESIIGASEKAEKAFREQYPAVYAHMLQYKEPLSKRNQAETGIRYEWYAMQRWGANYWEEFSKPKIIYPNMTAFMPFYYDEQLFITNQKCFIITGAHIAYLTALLNSSLFKFCFRENFPKLLGGTRELSKIFFDKIPLLQITDAEEEIFKRAVHDIQKEYTISKAMTIDNMIFSLYNLTQEEKEIIGFIEIQ